MMMMMMMMMVMTVRLLGSHNGRRKRVIVLGFLGRGLNELPLGELEHLAVERIARQVAMNARDRVTRGHGLEQRTPGLELAHFADLIAKRVDRLVVAALSPHGQNALQVEAVLGERARLVKHERVYRAANVDRARTDTVDLLLAQAILRVDESGGEGARQSGRHRNRDNIQRTLDYIRDGVLAEDLDGHRVDHADESDRGQSAHVLVRVVVEAKVDRLRVQDGAHQLALGGVESGAEHDGANLLVLVVASLDDLRAAEENVSTVVLDAQLDLLVELGRVVHAQRGAARARQGRLGDGHALAREHGLVDDDVAVEQHRIALHHGHVLDGDHVAGHQVLAADLFFVEAELARQILSKTGHCSRIVNDVSQGSFVLFCNSKYIINLLDLST